MQLRKSDAKYEKAIITNTFASKYQSTYTVCARYVTFLSGKKCKCGYD